MQGTGPHYSAVVPSCLLLDADRVAPCVAEILVALRRCVGLAAELEVYSQDASPSERQYLPTGAHTWRMPSMKKEDTKPVNP